MVNEVKRPRGRPRKNPILEEQVVPSVRSTQELTSPVPVHQPALLKVYIFPTFTDKPVGGIPRVVEAQIKHLPKFGIEIVEREDDADVIVCHTNIPPAFVKRFSRTPIVLISHGAYWAEYQWDKWALNSNKDQMESIRVTDTVVTCSEWVANSIRRHTSRSVEVIQHGVDYEEWQSDLTNKDYVLWNKFRTDPVCDPTPLNQVAALMPNQKFISTFGGKELRNVALTGELKFEDSKKLIQQAGVYLCTTRETFGIGTLEAMACGVPVVGFNYGGQAEFIEHKVDGWLAQPGDINGLAEGIQWALANRETVGAAARRKAKAFNWERFAEQYAKVFRKTFEKKTKEGPRTSIIVTNYNLHAYLGECLESVQNQTDQDWECIIVDDASPDKSGLEIAMRYAAFNKRFKVVSNDTNVYLAEARNVGIRLANGRYILPLDADDMLAPNTVATLSDALDNDRSIHVAYGGVFFVDEDGKTPTDYSKDYGAHLLPGKSSWPFQFEHEKQIQQMNLLPYCSMYRKEAWEQTGGYRRRCRTAEDADMWTRFSSYGFRPRMVTNDDTLIYRNRVGSMSRINSTEWIKWFSWTKLPAITPAGAVTKEQLPIPSLDPIIISVIIPVGPGHEKLVTDAVDSVDTQSFRNWECIVVNDSGKPLETELPSWVRVITTKGSEGPASARNAGIRASKGRLFLPLDADDYLEPDALQFMYDAYRKDPGVVYSDFWQSDMSGKRISVHHCDDYDPRFITGGKRTFEGQVREGMIHTVTALTPIWAWEKVGGYDEKLPAWEDWDFQIALGNIGVCSQRIPLPLFFYRKHTGFRREENYEFFERSKAGILSKWGDLWEGKKELMSCGACAAARKAGIPAQGIWAAKAARPINSGEAELIKYTGDKEGAISYRGPSKTMYLFGKGDTKFVLKEDVGMFLQYSEFELVQQEAIVPNASEPVLSAPGQA